MSIVFALPLRLRVVIADFAFDTYFVLRHQTGSGLPVAETLDCGTSALPRHFSHPSPLPASFFPWWRQRLREPTAKYILSHLTHSLHPSSKQRCSCFMPLLCPPPSCPLSRSLCVTCSTPCENPPKSPYERLRIDRKLSRLQFLRTYEAARRTAGGKNNPNTQTKLN